MASQLVEMLGLGHQEAEALYEAAGGNIELAMNLHFGGGDDVSMPSAGGTAFSQPFPWYGLVWPDAGEPVPESWLEQGLVFHPGTWGLVQGKNGPCGVLSVIQAYLIASLIDEKRADPNTIPRKEDLAKAISRALSRVSRPTPTSPVKICTWESAIGGSILTHDVSVDSLTQYISDNITAFTSRGCLPLIVYSGILTRGVEEVKGDVSADLGEPPLVLRPFYTCTSDLVGLFLRGEAKGNTSSYNMTGDKQDWASEIGILSYQEWESKVPIADGLKTPQYPVWILHGGDHFTTLYKPDEGLGKFTLWHWNGLPPGGPRLARITASAEAVASPAPDKHQETYKKPKKGAIEDVIQAKEEDKKSRPGKHTTWSYELLLAVEDPDIKDTPRGDSDVVAPTYHHLPPPEGPWRCASCYHGRYQTMCFGLNPPGDSCQHCGKSKQEALWSIWMKYDEMPKGVQGVVSKMFAPKFTVTLATKWPDISVEHEGKTPSV